MQDVIKRYFWVVGALAVMICAVFAAKATGHIIEAKFLGDPKISPKVTPAPQAPTVAKATHDKNGQQLQDRNMFCSDCTPPVVDVTTTDPSSIALTSLPLSLLATNIGATDKDSYATIINTESQKQGAFAIDDIIPGAGKLKTIKFKYVDFENGGRIERLVLTGATPPAVTPVAKVEEPKNDDNKDDLQSSIDNGIKKIDDTTYEIDKSLVDKVLANPMAVAKGARVVPAVKNGKPDGFKLYAIRPSSVYSKLGLSNGDTIQSINGFELTTADKALEVYTKLREATSLELEVTRRGKPVTLKYTIR